MRYLELFGLPGIGKTSFLGAVPDKMYVNDRKFIARFYHVLYGAFVGFQFLLLLLMMRTLMLANPRPVIVLAERIGLRCALSTKNVVLDEGILQSIWRSCCELRKTPYLFNCIVSFLSKLRFSYTYIRCSKVEHIKRVKLRGKVQRFDNGVIDGTYDSYTEGRSTMAFILLAARKANVRIVPAKEIDGL